MVTKQAAANLSESLPLRLRNFFARYPPQFYSAKVIPKPAPPPSSPPEKKEGTGTDTGTPSSLSSSSPPAEEQPSSMPPDGDLTASLPPLPSPYTPSRTRDPAAKPNNPNDLTTYSPSRAVLRSLEDHPNPFLPYRIPSSGHWRGPRLGLRRQAELVKLAAAHGVEELLPPGRKSREYKEVRRAEVGLRVRGTGIGQKVKGHKWERTMGPRLEERRQAMLKMPAMIRDWKQRGHGRGWKKYPRK